MRMSQLFSQTLREAPAESEVSSHQLLVRAGFIRQLGAGIFTYLPLAQRSLQKIMNIILHMFLFLLLVRKPDQLGFIRSLNK